MNSDKALLRKYEDDLNVSGTGVIIMGAWSIVRVLIELFMNGKEFLNIDEEDPQFFMIGMIIVFALVAVIAVGVMSVHLYIGLNAIRAARGKKYKKGYYAAAIIVTVLSVLSLATYINDFQDLEKIDMTLASMLVDITTTYFFLVVIISSVRIKGIKGES